MNSQKIYLQFHLVNEFFQEFNNYLTNEEGKKYPKRLENDIDKVKTIIVDLFLDIKRGILERKQSLYQIKRKLYGITNLFLSTFFMRMNKIRRNISLFWEPMKVMI